MNNEMYNVDVHDVINAVHRLKNGKSNGEEGLYSDHIIRNYTGIIQELYY